MCSAGWRGSCATRAVAVVPMASGVMATAYSRRAAPVCEPVCLAKSYGVPLATRAPPASPPSGPRSMIQSDARMTSRLCSMINKVCPAPRSLRKARISLATSSKCSPVVGSSNRKRLPFLARPEVEMPLRAASAKWPASFRRCASPPERVGTGCPSLTYSKPTSASGARPSCTSRKPLKKSKASETVMSSTSSIDAVRPRCSTLTSLTSGRKRLPSQSGQRRYTSDRNCISTCSNPVPLQVGHRPSPLLKLKVPAV